MNSFGKLMIVVGCLLIIVAVTGFVLVSSSGFGSNAVDTAIGLNNLLGSTAYMSSQERAMMWLMQYRVALLIAGIAFGTIGIVVGRLK